MRTQVSGHALFSVVVVFLVTVLLAAAKPANALPVYGYTFAPNWGFGSPQPVGIRICSDGAVLNSCISSLGLGGESDILNIGLLGRPIIQAALNEAGQQFFAGRLAAANEGAAQWWYITIPNAVWLLGGAPGWVYYFNDGTPGTVGKATDAIAYCNCNGLADILWASTFDPPGIDILPVDFDTTVSGFTVFDNTTIGNGPWTDSNAPPPSDEQCTGNVDASICNQTLNGDLLTTVPEPSTLALLGTGLAAFAFLRRRKSGTSPLRRQL